MIPAEFEEKTYEWPLYNQLERANPFVYTPGQVLEGAVGFDAATYVTNAVLWQTLGYSSPPAGTVLTGLAWPVGFGPREPKTDFPDVRLNLFLQAKRPVYYERRPRALKSLSGTSRVPHPSRSLRRVGFHNSNPPGILNSCDSPQPSCDI